MSPKNLLSTEKFSLFETGNRPKLHKVYIVLTGSQLIFCLAKKFAKLCILPDGFMELGPGLTLEPFYEQDT